MLADHVEWHMRQALAPMLFDDDEPAAGEALRPSIVAPAQRSPSARTKPKVNALPTACRCTAFKLSYKISAPSR